MNELDKIINDLPFEVEFSDVTEIDQIDERISAVGALFANTIGMLEGAIEFCPNEELPTLEESLSWIWTCRPELGEFIEQKDISKDLRSLIKLYRSGKMDEFWNLIS